MLKKLAIIILFFSSSLLFSQTNLQYLSSTTGAGCYDMVYYNNYLFTGAGNTLLVFDITTSVPYTKVFEHRFSSNIDDMQIKGNKLFIAANHAGLSMWNISTPATPVFIDDYQPDSLNEAAYNIAFFGDTVFVAYKTKMAAFKDNGSTLSLVKKFAYQPGTSIIRGCGVKNNTLAFVSSFGTNPQTGVHIYNAKTIQKLSFYPQNFCDPEDVVFGQNTNLLHVIGGTESYASLGLNPNGLFYSLDITNPSSPVEVYRDTIPGVYFFQISQPMNAENRNDTIFIATQGAQDMHYQSGDPLNGHIYVYDCTNPSNVHLINSEYAGLWHFDLALNKNKMYVASEWYGVKTIDITDLFNEVDNGNTLTGGWNLGSDKYGNRMVVGNEGFGFKLFDISDLKNPVLLDTNNEVGFCMKAKFSKNGNYIFGFFYTGDDFRVFDANNLNRLTSIQLGGGLTNDYHHAFVYQDKAFALQQSGLNYTVYSINVSNPLSPVIQTSKLMNNILDLQLHHAGKLIAATKDSLSILDPTTLNRLATIAPPSNFWNDFTSVTEYKDTLYAYVSGLAGGLIKYYYNGTNQLTQLGTPFTLPFNDPKYLAVDSFGLYACYVQQGLYALNKKTLAQTGYYRHSMEFVVTNQWGPQELFCKDDLFFLVEYMGQTSILSNDNGFSTSVKNNFNDSYLAVYPNPSRDHVVVDCSLVSGKNYHVKLYTIVGEVVQDKMISSDKKQIISTAGLPNGIYIISVESEAGNWSQRLIIGH